MYIRMTPFDYLKNVDDIDDDGEHESYIVHAYSRFMDNMIRIYYKFDFIDPGEPADSSITTLYPNQFVYNSDYDMQYTRTDNFYDIDSTYFEDSYIYWSSLYTHMLTVSTNTVYIYRETTEAMVNYAVDDPDFIPPYI